MLHELGVAAWALPAAAMRRMPAHRHAEAQLCGLDAGLAILETEAGSWLCPPGRCVWVPAGVEHSLRSCGRISGWMLHMRPDMADGLWREPRVLALSPLLRQVIVRVTTWVDDANPTEAKRHLLQVLCDEVAGSSAMPLYVPVPADPALKEMAALLAGQGGGVPSLAALARTVGVSERSLFRKFQQQTGMSPGQWRRQAQMLRSMELLTGGMSVTETALEVGYESTAAFIRAFRQVAGTTPHGYAQAQL